MQLKFFTDIIDSLSKIFSTIKSIANLPKENREEIRAKLGETFTMLNTSLNMVIIRLGDILRITDENNFRMELSQLSFNSAWINAEREFRLCQALKHALSEWEGLSASLVKTISTKDWEELKGYMKQILGNEWELADFIANKFSQFQAQALNNITDMPSLKTEIMQLQNALNTERRKLMQLELDMYSVI